MESFNLTTHEARIDIGLPYKDKPGRYITQDEFKPASGYTTRAIFTRHVTEITYIDPAGDIYGILIRIWANGESTETYVRY